MATLLEELENPARAYRDISLGDLCKEAAAAMAQQLAALKTARLYIVDEPLANALTGVDSAGPHPTLLEVIDAALASTGEQSGDRNG